MKKLNQILFTSTILLFLFISPIISQYAGGDFVNSNEKDKKEEKYQVETTDELVKELHTIIKTEEIGPFPRKRVDCLNHKITKDGTEKALKLMRKVIPLLPNNYRVVVVGHADRRGNEVSSKKEKGNDYWSEMRGRCVAAYIVEQYPEAESKIMVGGMGSKMNKRAVDFQILSKEKAESLHKTLIQSFKTKKPNTKKE